MARDRFIYWQRERRPTVKEAASVAANFFGESIATEVVADGQRITISIRGGSTDPYRGLGAKSMPIRPDRWIEVFLADDNLDVITREQDQLTNALADGLAMAYATFWHGRKG